MPTLKLEFDDKFDQLLQKTASDENIAPDAKSKPEVIRRAVALYYYLHSKVDDKAQEQQVAIIDKNKVVVEIIDPLP